MRRLAAPALLSLLVGCGAFELPEDVEVRAEAPVSASTDEAFKVVLTVRNTGSETKTLVDVDIADEFLEGVVIQSMDPPFKDAMHIPFDNTQSYSMDLPVPPGQTVTVTVNAYAAHAGDWSGDVDFCIDSAVSCISYPMRTIVR
jgi:hypothetical protein